MAGGGHEMCRSLNLQPPPQWPWQQGIKPRSEVVGANLGQFGLAGKARGKPLRHRLGERLIAQVRPVAGLGRRQEFYAVAQLVLGWAPEQALQPELADASGQ